uniref:Ataxin 2-like n=1 Tax=Cyclopterus lumpus TaxID=8103 RepID=A0A8C2WCJ0_CYCLU
STHFQTTFEGIFKTLSSQCELAVDAVHKQSDGGGGEEGQSSPPKIEDITDTMIFSPGDLVTMTCRDVDLNFAVRDTFTDTSISSSRVNGDNREKVLQRWDGNGNGENFELEADTSNGWDANEMFKFNEETYGVKSTYDASLSMYTMPLEKGNSEVFRQREARASRLANEIEGSLQYRRRVSLENDEGRSEEDKYSSVVREDRASPGFTPSSREGKYIPLPQRAREIGRTGASGRTAPPPPSSRQPPPGSSSDRSSPLSLRTTYSPHQAQGSPPAAGSPPCSNHVLPHSLSHPQALADSTRSAVNGGTEEQLLMNTCNASRGDLLQPTSSPSASPASADPPPHSSASSSSSSSSSPAPPPKPAQDLQQVTEVAPTFTAPSAGPESFGPEGRRPGPSPGGEDGRPESGERPEAAATAQVKNSTLNPNAKEFLPIKVNIVQKPAPTPTPPRPTPPSPSLVLAPPGQPGGGAIYSNPPGHYLSYVSPLHLQGHQMQEIYMYMYSVQLMTCVVLFSGPVVGQRPEHHASQASSMISAAASAAGPPLVASPYPQSYLQYGQVIQALPPHFHGQPVYSMLQGGARMLTAGAPPPQMGPPGPQYPGQAEGPQQAMYAQSFSHHSGALHHPQPSSTPTGNQPPPQHSAPSPGHNQSSQAGPQPQSMFHSGGLQNPAPPNLPPGHSSPQTSYTMQGYSLPGHQPLAHGFPSISQLTQAHVAGGLSGPHHSGGHGLPPVMLHYVSPQQGAGSNPQHGPQQGAPQHFYIGHPQGTVAPLDPDLV